MGSDWDYINEHMGGHDEDGLPNFMSEPGFADDLHVANDPDYFETFQEAMAWAKENPGRAIARSSDGYGYIVKNATSGTNDHEIDKSFLGISAEVTKEICWISAVDTVPSKSNRLLVYVWSQDDLGEDSFDIVMGAFDSGSSMIFIDANPWSVFDGNGLRKLSNNEEVLYFAFMPDPPEDYLNML